MTSIFTAYPDHQPVSAGEQIEDWFTHHSPSGDSARNGGNGPMWNTFSIDNQTNNDLQIVLSIYGEQTDFFNFLTGSWQFNTPWSPMGSGQLDLIAPPQEFFSVVKGPIFDNNTDVDTYFTFNGANAYVNFGVSCNGIQLNSPPLCFSSVDFQGAQFCRIVSAGFGDPNADTFQASIGNDTFNFAIQPGALRGTLMQVQVYYAFNILITT